MQEEKKIKILDLANQISPNFKYYLNEPLKGKKISIFLKEDLKEITNTKFAKRYIDILLAVLLSAENDEKIVETEIGKFKKEIKELEDLEKKMTISPPLEFKSENIIYNEPQTNNPLFNKQTLMQLISSYTILLNTEKSFKLLTGGAIDTIDTVKNNIVSLDEFIGITEKLQERNNSIIINAVSAANSAANSANPKDLLNT